MNKACSPGPSIEADAAAALMAPLTELVVRAGAAIMAVDRAAMRIEGKVDGSPVTEADLAADRIINEGLARLVPGVPALSEERADLAKPPYRGQFLSDRSARRHQGIRRRANRVHGQSRLGDERDAIIGHHWRPRAWIDLARPCRSGRGTAGDGERNQPDRADSYPPLPASRHPLDGGGQPLARRCQDRSLYRR